MRSALGRWARLAGVPAAALVAMALVGAPAFAAESTPSHPTPPGCVIVIEPAKAGDTAKPVPGKPGQCTSVCIIKLPGGGAPATGTTDAATTGGAGGVVTGKPGKPGECPVCPLPPGHPTTGSGGVAGSDQGAGTVVTQPGKKCVICVVTQPGHPGTPTTQSAPTKPIPGDPAKCEIHPIPATK
jgi:hypothetical protein